MKSIISFSFLFSFLFLVVSCSKDDTSPKQDKDNGNKKIEYRIDTTTEIQSWKVSATLDSVIVRNLPADPATRDPKDGHIINENNRYTFFRFSDSTVVLYDSTVAPRNDSATTKWDIAFHGTTIILNSNIHGPGEVEGQSKSSTFEKITEAPESGYKKDQETGNVFSTWYNYNPQNHVISAKPGYMLIIHTQDDKYVKMEIIGYYKGRPKHPSIKTEQRYYTFRYIIQQDGSKEFSK